MGLLQTLRDRLTIHRKHLLEHELKSEQGAASQTEPPSVGLAGPILGGPVNELPMEAQAHPLPARDEDLDQPRED